VAREFNEWILNVSTLEIWEGEEKEELSWN
jgi:hypothetical protein